MHQRIGMDDEDDKGRQSKKGFERQFDIEEGQFDRANQQKIFMGDGARRDRDIGENEEIGEPQAAAEEAASSTDFLISSRSSALAAMSGREVSFGSLGAMTFGGFSILGPGFCSSEAIWQAFPRWRAILASSL